MKKIIKEYIEEFILSGKTVADNRIHMQIENNLSVLRPEELIGTLQATMDFVKTYNRTWPWKRASLVRETLNSL